MPNVIKEGWTAISLGDLFRIKHGYAFKGEFFLDRGDYILLTPGNFKPQGGLKLKGDKEKFYSADFPREYLLSRDDLVVVMTDLTQEAQILGSPAFITADNRYLHNQRLGKIIEIKRNLIDPVFIFYLFNSDGVRRQIRASATGATVRHTAPERIYAVRANIPPLPLQRRITAILSAYDDLIENNTRRIQILEEIARRIYEEWFVHFRFPGHENVRMAETELGLIPEGWKLKRLGEVLELAYGKALKADEREKGSVPVYGSSGIVGFHSVPLVAEAGIIVGRKGNVGRVHLSDVPFYPIDTVYYIKTELPLPYVFFNLKRQHFINNDAAVPGLNRNQARSLPFILPPDPLVNKFDSLARNLFGLSRKLQTKIGNLSRTRDLLLPKLISGEVDVSNFPEPE